MAREKLQNAEDTDEDEELDKAAAEAARNARINAEMSRAARLAQNESSSNRPPSNSSRDKSPGRRSWRYRLVSLSFLGHMADISYPVFLYLFIFLRMVSVTGVHISMDSLSCSWAAISLCKPCTCSPRTFGALYFGSLFLYNKLFLLRWEYRNVTETVLSHLYHIRTNQRACIRLLIYSIWSHMVLWSMIISLLNYHHSIMRTAGRRF